MSGIRLHKEWGLNPTMPVCIVCGKDRGEITLLGAAYPGHAPMRMVMDVEPCAECKEKYLKQGVLMVEANRETFIPTGRLAVIKVEAFQKLFSKMEVPNKHIAFVEPGLLAKIGVFGKDVDFQQGADHA